MVERAVVREGKGGEKPRPFGPRSDALGAFVRHAVMEKRPKAGLIDGLVTLQPVTSEVIGRFEPGFTDGSDVEIDSERIEE